MLQFKPPMIENIETSNRARMSRSPSKSGKLFSRLSSTTANMRQAVRTVVGRAAVTPVVHAPPSYAGVNPTSSHPSFSLSSVDSRSFTFGQDNVTFADIPTFLIDAFNVLMARGLDAEGLFRKEGNATRIKTLWVSFLSGSGVSLELAAITDVCSLIKRFLREMHDPLFDTLQDQFVRSYEQIHDEATRLKAVLELCFVIRHPHLSTLAFLMRQLKFIVDNQRCTNRMTSHALATVFAASIFREPPPKLNPSVNAHNAVISAAKDMRIRIALVEMMIDVAPRIGVQTPLQKLMSPNMFDCVFPQDETTVGYNSVTTPRLSSIGGEEGDKSALFDFRAGRATAKQRRALVKNANRTYADSQRSRHSQSLRDSSLLDSTIVPESVRRVHSVRFADRPPSIIPRRSRSSYMTTTSASSQQTSPVKEAREDFDDQPPRKSPRMEEEEGINRKSSTDATAYSTLARRVLSGNGRSANRRHTAPVHSALQRLRPNTESTGLRRIVLRTARTDTEERASSVIDHMSSSKRRTGSSSVRTPDLPPTTVRTPISVAPALPSVVRTPISVRQRRQTHIITVNRSSDGDQDNKEEATAASNILDELRENVDTSNIRSPTPAPSSIDPPVVTLSIDPPAVPPSSNESLIETDDVFTDDFSSAMDDHHRAAILQRDRPEIGGTSSKEVRPSVAFIAQHRRGFVAGRVQDIHSTSISSSSNVPSYLRPTKASMYRRQEGGTKLRRNESKIKPPSVTKRPFQMRPPLTKRMLPPPQDMSKLVTEVGRVKVTASPLASLSSSTGSPYNTRSSTRAISMSPLNSSKTKPLKRLTNRVSTGGHSPSIGRSRTMRVTPHSPRYPMRNLHLRLSPAKAAHV